MPISQITTLPSQLTRPQYQSDLLVSVVVPFLNEQEVLPEFFQRLNTVLERLTVRSEIVFIDDGSTDQSVDVVRSFVVTSSEVRCLSLSRNFGKENALSAGLEHTKGDAVIVIDADLQDPPELIPKMIDAWQQGYDVINMQRNERLGESWLKRFSAKAFYRLINRMSQMDIPENVGDFRLMSAEVVDQINQMPERNRYMKGIFAWPGYKQKTLTFKRDPRFCGETKWNYLKLIGLAMDGITSFSIRPLRMATIAGTITALSSFIYGLWIVLKTMVFGELVTGYPSMMVVVLGLGGVQLLSIGLLGEYIGRIFVETKKRPLYIVKSLVEKKATSLPQNETRNLGETA